jgi:lauroyl/myristoyl acyltransferase
VRQRLAGWAYAAGWAVVRAVPAPVARAGFRAGADHVTRRDGAAVRRLAGNLRRVVGPGPSDAELDLLVRDGMRSYLRYWLEAFRLPSLPRTAHATFFQLTDGGEAELARLVAAGRGAVVALPHAGNWDAAGAYVAGHGWPIVTVAERLRPESLYQRFLAFREGLGMEILPLHGGPRPPLDVLAEKLAAGYLVPLLADRDLSARGVPVTFFGAPTRMPAGPALLALRTGAPLYTVDMWYEPAGPRGRLRGPLRPPTDGPLDQRVRATTQLIADSLALGIAAHPVDWHMLQRLWLPDAADPPAADQPAADPPAADQPAVAGSTLPGDAPPAADPAATR